MYIRIYITRIDSIQKTKDKEEKVVTRERTYVLLLPRNTTLRIIERKREDKKRKIREKRKRERERERKTDREIERKRNSTSRNYYEK